MKKLATVMALAGIAAASSAAPQRRTPAKRATAARPATSAPPRFDPKMYAASIAGVDCSNVASRASSIVPAEKALRGIASAYSYGAPTKREFESTTAFDQRVRGEISVALGGTERVVAVIPIRDMMKYDADTSTLTIDPVESRVKQNVITVKAYSDIDRNGSYVGSNAYGASAQVSRETFTQFYMLLPARGSTSFSRTMPSDAARSLKENGSLILVGSILSPYIAYERRHGAATISDPTDTTYLKFYLGMVAECAIVANGGQEIGRFPL